MAIFRFFLFYTYCRFVL